MKNFKYEDTDNVKSFYKKNGYAIVENIFSDSECEEFKKQSQKFAEPPEYPVALNVHRKSDFFFKTISSEKIVKVVKFIQDSEIDAVNDQFLFKMKNTKYGKQSWTLHQDNSYPRAKHGSYIIVHVAVDESRKDNGGLIFLEGSHKEEILEFENNKSWKEDYVDGKITRPGQTIKNQTLIEKYKKIDVIFPKGSICLMHGNLVHGSYANLSEEFNRNQYSMCYMNRGVDFFVGKTSPRIRKKLY
tara:strand:- start:474 stop:1205 length:732 start_codon:yes stop_codon:yes gene_type:complete